MGLFNKLTKKSMKLIDLHTHLSQAEELLGAYNTMLIAFRSGLTLNFDWEGDASPDFMEQPKLLMSDDKDEIVKFTQKNSHYWNSWLGIHLDCFSIAQNECSLEENFNPAMKDALRNIHQMFLHDIRVLYESSSEVKELSEDHFKNSLKSGMDLLDFFREEGRNHPGLYYVSSYYLENGWELEQVKEFQNCKSEIKALSEFHGNICNLYSGFLDNVIIKDWEEYLT